MSNRRGKRKSRAGAIPPADAFGRFLAEIRPGTRTGRRGSVAEIDAAPRPMEDLAAYFVAVSADELRHVWVAAVVDASTRPHTAGELARALVVVAERLTRKEGRDA